MSALETAIRVVRWATRGGGPPPRGDLRSPLGLARPPGAAREALGQLSSVTAARLAWCAPPLGDARPPGAGALLIAAAIGAEDPRASQALLEGAGPSGEVAWDWVLRHGLVARSLAHLSPPLGDWCRLASSLTALLDRPAGGQHDEAIAAARRVLGDPAARLSLQLRLARPCSETAVRDWRRELMDRLWRADEPGREFVLGIYEATLLYYEAEATAQLEGAVRRFDEVRGRIGGEGNSLGDEDWGVLAGVASAYGWWVPLLTIERNYLESLRSRRFPYRPRRLDDSLDELRRRSADVRQLLELYQMARRLRSSAAGEAR